MSDEQTICAHEWRTDGQHSNEFCKFCFATKPQVIIGFENLGNPLPTKPPNYYWIQGYNTAIEDAAKFVRTHAMTNYQSIIEILPHTGSERMAEAILKLREKP